jgi:hypothetical protein
MGVSGSVRALTVFDDGSGPALYAGGLFDEVGGMTVNRIARWGCPASEPICYAMCTGPFDYVAGEMYAVGILPRDVAAGDLTGNGIVDAVVVSINGDVTVLLGAGDGTFTPQPPLAAGNGPFSVELADLDGDGDLDIVVANYYSHDVSVLLNDGAGVFAAPVSYAVGDTPVDLAIADLDLDGDLDIGVANRESDDVSILLNNGDGTFAPQTRVMAGDEPFGLAFGDIDGDGYPDLAVANGTSDDLSVILNEGDATFSGEMRYPAGDRPWNVVLGDLDGDGYLDLAAVSGRSDDVSVLLNNGDGTFAEQVRYAVDDEPRTLLMADLDGDGDLDLVSANPGADNSVSVLLNNGDETFAAKESFFAGLGAVSMALADLEGDGDLDMVVAHYESGSVGVLLSECTPRCVKQWAVEDGGNGHWYSVRLVPEGLNWTQARVLAHGLGGHLATMTSEAENDWVFENLVDDRVYWNSWRDRTSAGSSPWDTRRPDRAGSGSPVSRGRSRRGGRMSRTTPVRPRASCTTCPGQALRLGRSGCGTTCRLRRRTASPMLSSGPATAMGTVWSTTDRSSAGSCSTPTATGSRTTACSAPPI